MEVAIFLFVDEACRCVCSRHLPKASWDLLSLSDRMHASRLDLGFYWFTLLSKRVEGTGVRSYLNSNLIQELKGLESETILTPISFELKGLESETILTPISFKSLNSNLIQELKGLKSKPIFNSKGNILSTTWFWGGLNLQRCIMLQPCPYLHLQTWTLPVQWLVWAGKQKGRNSPRQIKTKQLSLTLTEKNREMVVWIQRLSYYWKSKTK